MSSKIPFFKVGGGGEVAFNKNFMREEGILKAPSHPLH
jgi:hypothetical protein